MIIRRATLDEVYNLARAAGLHTAERLVDTLAEPLRRGDLDSTRLLYAVLVQALADERAHWETDAS